MIRHLSHVAVVLIASMSMGPSTLGHEDDTAALFELESRAMSPFPSDWHTRPDATQNTGRRVSLTDPNCEVNVSECEDLAVINQLDGFNLQPRLSIPFSGPIDPASVTSDTVRLLSLGSTVANQDVMPWGTVVGIDQVVWDPASDTLHVESDALLAQHTRFALIVTRGVRAAGGAPVQAAEPFRRFRHTVRGEYKHALLEAMQVARHRGVRERDIAVASVFTTQSATALLEKIRDQIHHDTPDPADFLLGPAGERTVFPVSQVTSIAWRQQRLVDPPYFPSPPVALPLSSLNAFPGTVAHVAFGKFASPDYQVHPGEYIPPIGTRSVRPVVQSTVDLYFNLFLPSGQMPSNGWPVAIVGHPVNNSKNMMPFQVASSMAKYGVATIAITAVGHGFGSRSTLTVNRTAGVPITFPAGGRGIDQPPEDGTIEDSEGLSTPRPRAAVVFSDAYRQTAVDLVQLARVIEVGIDADGDEQRDLDASRIYYLGNSLGGGYGTVFLGVEPDVRVGVIAVPFDPIPGGPLGIRRIVPGEILDAREPSLLNAPGINAIDGLAIGPPHFDENRPLRNQTQVRVGLTDSTTRVIQSPVTNTVVGAMAIQAAFENFEWVSQAGSPLPYAPHLRKAPLWGMPVKSVLFQIARGDQTAQNPTTTAILRAGDLAETTLYYRHDLARLEFPALPANPHGFVIGLANFGAIALGAQAQAARFLQSAGADVIHPEPRRFFEVPIPGPLPEGLNFPE